MTFPVNVRGGVVTYDDRFAPHITGKSLRKLSFQTHQFLNYSFSRVAPVNQWMDLGPGPRVDMGEKGAFGIGMTAIVRREGAPLDAGDRLLEGLTRRAVPVTLYSDQRVRETDGWRIVDFNEDVTNTDVLAEFAAGYTGPVLAIHGKDDTTVDPEWSNKIVAASTNEASKTYFIDGMDHTFNVFSEEDFHSLYNAVDATGEFFKATLAD